MAEEDNKAKFLDTAQRDPEALRFAIGRLFQNTEEVIKRWTAAEPQQKQKIVNLIKQNYPEYDTEEKLFWALGEILKVSSDTSQPQWSSVQSVELQNLLIFVQALQREIEEIIPHRTLRPTQGPKRVEAPTQAPPAVPPREPPSPGESAEFLSQTRLDIDIDSRSGDCVLRDPLQSGSEIARVAGFTDAALEELENTSRAITFEIKHELGEIYIHVDWEDPTQKVNFLINGYPVNIPVDRGNDGIEQALRYFAEYLKAEQADTGKFQNPLEPQKETATEKREIPSHLPHLWSAVAFSRDDFRAWGKAEEPTESIREKLQTQFTRTNEIDSTNTESLKAGQDKAIYRPDLGVYIICDGVSSQQSEPIVEYTTKIILEKMEGFHTNLEDPDIIMPALDEVIQDTAKEVYTWAKSQGLRGATTLTLCVFRGSRLFTFNIGDSPASIYRPHNPPETRFETLTVNHNITFEMYHGNQDALDLINSHFRNAANPKDAQYLGDIQIPPPLLEICEHYSQVLAKEDVRSKRRLAIAELKIIATQARGAALLPPQESRRVIELLYNLESMIVNGIGQAPRVVYSASVCDFGPDDILRMGSDSIKNLTDPEELAILERYDAPIQATLELGTSIVDGLVQKRPRAGIDDTSIILVKRREAATATAEYISEARTILNSISKAEIHSKATAVLDRLEQNDEGKSPYEICRIAKQVRDKTEKLLEQEKKQRKSLFFGREHLLEQTGSMRGFFRMLDTKYQEGGIQSANQFIYEVLRFEQYPNIPNNVLDVIEALNELQLGLVWPDYILTLIEERKQLNSAPSEEIQNPKLSTDKSKLPEHWSTPLARWIGKKSTRAAAFVLAFFTALATPFVPQLRKAKDEISQAATILRVEDPNLENIENQEPALRMPAPPRREASLRDAAPAVPDLPIIDAAPVSTEKPLDASSTSTESFDASDPLRDATYSPDFQAKTAEASTVVKAEPILIEKDPKHSQSISRVVIEAIKKAKPAINPTTIERAVGRYVIDNKLPWTVHEGDKVEYDYTISDGKVLIKSIEHTKKADLEKIKVEIKPTPKVEPASQKQTDQGPELPEQTPGKTIQIGAHTYEIGKALDYIPLAKKAGKYMVIGLSEDKKAVLLQNAENPKAPQFAVNLKNAESRVLAPNTEKFTIDSPEGRGLLFEKIDENTIKINYTTVSGNGVIEALATFILHQDYKDDEEKIGAAVSRAMEIVKSADKNGHIPDTFDANSEYSIVPNLVVSTNHFVITQKDKKSEWSIQSAHFARSKKEKALIY